MILSKPKKNAGIFEIIDIRSYLNGNPFKESEFRDSLKREDWTRFTDKRVLIRGCGRTPIPTWAFMLALVKLGSYPRMVAYGEECAPVVVYRRNDVSEAEERDIILQAENSGK